ncbi:hypothetical protein FDP41_009518 [Naegleria fowleri]|uniref:Uncharacterized protein n=1 Tax=Naegleria fowleri TaxID=5763 RepID=A0A6A5BDS2_NAEFO|nr:uncharacterized protein FDP41_009518 [Naegleria fowleri]KAF0972210.1 hypothetical protein FDP41_009518 [Naegleria fowleri]
MVIEIEQDRLEFNESYEEAKKIKETYFGVNMDKFIKYFESGKYTIPTETLPLQISEVKALLHLCKKHSRKQFTLRNEDLHSISQLTQKIDQIMQRMKQDHQLSNGFIVKLTSRSAKDITPTHERTMKLYSEMMMNDTSKHQTFSDYSSQCTDDNDKENPQNHEEEDLHNSHHQHHHEFKMNEHLCALYFASLQCMRVFDANEALQLLTQSSIIEYDLALDLTFE